MFQDDISYTDARWTSLDRMRNNKEKGDTYYNNDAVEGIELSGLVPPDDFFFPSTSAFPPLRSTLARISGYLEWLPGVCYPFQIGPIIFFFFFFLVLPQIKRESAFSKFKKNSEKNSHK